MAQSDPTYIDGVSGIEIVGGGTNLSDGGGSSNDNAATAAAIANTPLAYTDYFKQLGDKTKKTPVPKKVTLTAKKVGDSVLSKLLEILRANNKNLEPTERVLKIGQSMLKFVSGPPYCFCGWSRSIPEEVSEEDFMGEGDEDEYEEPGGEDE